MAMTAEERRIDARDRARAYRANWTPEERAEINERQRKYKASQDDSVRVKKNEVTRERARASKQLLANISNNGECMSCGYDDCIAALDFHHRVPAEKLFGINGQSPGKYSWEQVLEELEKCDLLCANCHREHHYEHGR